MGEGPRQRAAAMSRFQLIWEGGAGEIPVGVAGHPGLVSHPYELEGEARGEPRTHGYLSVCLSWGLGSHLTDSKVICPSQAAKKSSRPSCCKDLSGGLEASWRKPQVGQAETQLIQRIFPRGCCRASVAPQALEVLVPVHNWSLELTALVYLCTSLALGELDLLATEDFLEPGLSHFPSPALGPDALGVTPGEDASHSLGHLGNTLGWGAREGRSPSWRGFTGHFSGSPMSHSGSPGQSWRSTWLHPAWECMWMHRKDVEAATAPCCLA